MVTGYSFFNSWNILINFDFIEQKERDEKPASQRSITSRVKAGGVESNHEEGSKSFVDDAEVTCEILHEYQREGYKLIEFLMKAKKQTYAGKGAEKGSPSRPKSHDLEYSEGNLKYIDTYLGSEKFSGEEALWENDIPVWSMNYCGRLINNGFEGDFLKEALSNVPKELPYRGPREYKKGNFTYQCSINGDFQWFTGFEEIFNGDVKVYECMFHGGLVL